MTPRTHHLALLSVLLLTLAACDALNPSDEANDSDTDEEAVLTIETTAEGPVSDDHAAEDTTDPVEQSPDVEEATSADEAPETPSNSGLHDDAGTPGGTLTVDGETIAFDGTHSCQPPENVAGEGTGVQEMIDEMDVLNLFSTADEGDFAVHLAEFEFVSLEIVWTPHPGDVGYRAGLLDLAGDGSWVDGDSTESVPDAPIEVHGDHVTGVAALTAMGSDDQVEVSYELPIPAEVTC